VELTIGSVIRTPAANFATAAPRRGSGQRPLVLHWDVGREAAAFRQAGYRTIGVDCAPAEGVETLDVTDDAAVSAFAANLWFRPLCLSVSQGYWVNLLKVTRAGVLSRHRHTNPVHGYVLKGRWHYLEHDWVAEEGGYVYEPPGETHTLVVPEGVDEMITLFQVNGIMLYVDPDGNALGYEDVFTKIAMCRKHYEACGLGADYVDRFIR
jgi:2,4'-dihydroxyacetophenone dioxygenase